MPILDLVTPWLATVEADAPTDAATGFRARWGVELGALQRQRAPLGTDLPTPTHPVGLMDRAASADLHQTLREARQFLSTLGVSPPLCTTVLAALEGPGAAFEVVPDRDAPMVFVLLDRIPDHAALRITQVRALLTLARCSPPTPSLLASCASEGAWDRWAAARVVPVREWVYTAGLAEHAVRAVAPEVEDHVHFGISRSAFRRLREQERALRDRLAADLPLAGLGPWLRWIGDDAPPSVRSDGGTPIPKAAGRYLGWRLTAERVARVGLAEALMMES